MPIDLHLKPAPGLVVRCPVTGDKLPPDGAAVADSSYWHRRLAEGDVVPIQGSVEAQLQTSAESKTRKAK